MEKIITTEGEKIEEDFPLPKKYKNIDPKIIRLIKGEIEFLRKIISDEFYNKNVPMVVAESRDNLSLIKNDPLKFFKKEAIKFEEEKNTKKYELYASIIEELEKKEKMPETNPTEESDEEKTEVERARENLRKKIEENEALEARISKELAMLDIEDRRDGELENPEITVEDCIQANPLLTDYGKEYAQKKENREATIKEGKIKAALSFKYLLGKISPEDLIFSSPYRYIRENIDKEEAKEYADKEALYWKPVFDRINTKYDQEITNLK
jgi:hypothetical protein